MRIMDPAVPEVARDLATSAATVSLLATAFAFPYAFSQPVLGPMADALGKARIIKVCLSVLLVTLLIAAVAPTIEILFAARVVSGIAAGGIIPVALAMVGDRFSMNERHVAISRINMAAVTGQLTSAIGAGLVASLWSWRIALAAAGSATLAVLIASLLKLAPRPKAEAKKFTYAGFKSGYATIFANPRAIVCYGAVSVEGIAVYGIIPYVATLFEAQHIGGVREAGIVIAGIGIGGLIYTLRVKTLLNFLGGVFNVMRAGGMIAAAGLCIVAWQPAWPVQFGAFALLGMGFFMVHNGLQMYATELAPDARGSAVALHAFFFFLGQAVGPVLYRLGFASIGVAATVMCCAAAMVAVGLLAPRALERFSARP